MSAAKRKWGQHWLASDAIASDLVSTIGVSDGERVLEIGPGTGRMTRALLASGADVCAVEVDPECRERLAVEHAGDTFRVIGADLLEADGEIPWERGPFRVVGNLPYNISSPILRWTVSHRTDLVDAHYMLQTEVAERVAAGPGSRTYGLLSVIVQAAWEPHLLRRLAPGAFRPPPKVESAFLRLDPAASDGLAVDLEIWIPAAEGAFQHRRKKLANALRLAGHDRERVEAALEATGIDGGARAERLSPADFARLGRELAAS